MRKNFKKLYLILFIIALFISVASIFLLMNRNQKLEFAKSETNIIESNSIIPVDETTTENNELIENVIISDTADETTIELENVEPNNSQVKVQEKTQEKVPEKVQVTKDNQTQEKTTTTDKIHKQETVVTTTKEETIQPQSPTPSDVIINPVETKPTENTEPNDIVNSNEPSPDEPVDTIKRISEEQLEAETAKYLQDIQNIVPGLTYKNVKRGQVFWPYRTTEIDISVGGLDFGIIYYYVDTFVESNQEKFKYYIDWAGNE